MEKNLPIQCPCLQGSYVHSFRVSCSHVLPVVPAGHKQANSVPSPESMQVPPLRQGELSQEVPAN